MTAPYTAEPVQEVIEKLIRAGESRLAATLSAHANARRCGAPLDTLRKIWLEGEFRERFGMQKKAFPAPIIFDEIF